MWFHSEATAEFFISKCNIWLLIIVWLGQDNFIVSDFVPMWKLNFNENWISEPAYMQNGNTHDIG